MNIQTKQRAAASVSATTSSFAVTLAKKAAQERLDALQKDSYNATNFFAFTKRARDDGADDEDDGEWQRSSRKITRKKKESNFECAFLTKKNNI